LFIRQFSLLSGYSYTRLNKFLKRARLENGK